MNDYERGDVVWSDDPFKDDPEAGRPWLLIANDRQPFRGEQAIAIALSTSGHDQAIPIETPAWIEGGLPRRSYALPWAAHSPQRRDVDRHVGRLDLNVVREVVAGLEGYIE